MGVKCQGAGPSSKLHQEGGRREESGKEEEKKKKKTENERKKKHEKKEKNYRNISKTYLLKCELLNQGSALADDKKQSLFVNG